MRPSAKLLLALPVLAAAFPAQAAETRAQAVEQAVDAVMAARGLGAATGPGCAVSVTRAGQVLMSKGYGSADIAHKVAFTPRTVSETGSVAKQFTAASILILAEQGKLSLDDDIRKYLPEMPDYGTKIRIYDLVHQTSGLREWTTLAALRGSPRHYKKAYSMADFFGIVTSQRALNFTPGERYEYSNTNYGLLTFIVARVSGMSAAEFGKRHLFGPLGMTSTQWRDDRRRVVAGRATAYGPAAGAGAGAYEEFMPNEDVYGHGAILTTVEDMQIWNRAVLGGGGLSPYVVAGLLRRGVLADGRDRDYAGGIYVTRYRDRPIYRHGGNTAGYSAQLWAFPEEAVSVALLCNVRTAETEIAARAADAALGLPPPPPAAATPVGAAPPTGPTAYFRSAHGEVIATRTDGPATFVNIFTGAGFTPLAPSPTPGVFSIREDIGPTELRFESPDRIALRVDTREPGPFIRVPPARRSSADLAGRYDSPDLGVAYQLRRSGEAYRLELAGPGVDDPVAFNLEWLYGDTYFARVDSRSGLFRNSLMATFIPGVRGAATKLRLSSVGGLQAVDDLEFTRAPRR